MIIIIEEEEEEKIYTQTLEVPIKKKYFKKIRRKSISVDIQEKLLQVKFISKFKLIACKLGLWNI
jgi:hypothetical protein